MAKVRFDIPTTVVEHPPSTESAQNAQQADYIVPAEGKNWRNAVHTRRLEEPSPWSVMERVGYTLHTTVWWARRITGNRSRTSDAQQVANFLRHNRLWDDRRGTASAIVSDRALKRLDIQRQFWWINDAQIQTLANALSAVHRQDTDKAHNLENLTMNALFSPPADLGND